ncbi:hypothetical protein [Nocardia wallacei]|uniref:hypothetical protein n=1 Tax=Nocardia wallacei TaxID=480035 RepID=UPI002455DBE5|nr:hypothetical protein [Nocardia wallacei]
MVRAYAIVREDISKDATDAHVTRLRELAAAWHWNLRGVLVASDDSHYGLLLATFRDSQIAKLLVPSVVHVTGWLELIRCHVDVETLEPRMQWPRLPAPQAEAAAG